MTDYQFHQFVREDQELSLSIPELSDGFDPSLPEPPFGMMPISFFTEKVPFGIYQISLCFTAEAEVNDLYLFTGRKQLREICSLKKGESFHAVYYQSVAEIIPRYHDRVFPVEHLFFTVCTSQPEAIRLGKCCARRVKGSDSGDDKGVFRIFLCGDSTVTEHSSEIPYHPGACYAAWGQTLSAFLDGKAAIENQAHCGLTTEDFRREGHWEIVLRHIQKDDICLFQFGHNDQKLSHLWPGGEYPGNLLRFIDETKKKGGYPVLVTPLGRNIWNSEEYLDLLEEHSSSVQTIGRDFHVPVIDLHRYSVTWIKEHGMEASRNYFHLDDYTHTNEYGACLFAEWIAGELSAIFPERLRAVKKIKEFMPLKNLWETLGQSHIIRGTGRKEQFDQMEKSTAGLLDVIMEAKKKSEQWKSIENLPSAAQRKETDEDRGSRP